MAHSALRQLVGSSNRKLKRKQKKRTALSQNYSSQVLAQRIQIAAMAHSALRKRKLVG